MTFDSLNSNKLVTLLGKSILCRLLIKINVLKDTASCHFEISYSLVTLMSQHLVILIHLYILNLIHLNFLSLLPYLLLLHPSPLCLDPKFQSLLIPPFALCYKVDLIRVPFICQLDHKPLQILYKLVKFEFFHVSRSLLTSIA